MHNILVGRFTGEEMQQIKAAAEKAHLSMRAFLRLSAFFAVQHPEAIINFSPLVENSASTTELKNTVKETINQELEKFKEEIQSHVPSQSSSYVLAKRAILQTIMTSESQRLANCRTIDQLNELLKEKNQAISSQLDKIDPHSESTVTEEAVLELSTSGAVEWNCETGILVWNLDKLRELQQGRM
jgi:hypothetical protein